MNKQSRLELAKQISTIKQSINNIEQWKERYIVRAMLSKIISDSNHTYTVEEIEQSLAEI